MKVTITIEDDGDGSRIDFGDATSGPYIRGPYIRGPYFVIPREDGTETEIDIAAMAAAAEEKNG